MKKVLIIAFYWPPSSGSGVQRWLKFSKYLPENNWQPIIVTPALSYYYQEDASYKDDIHEKTKVVHIPQRKRKSLFYWLFKTLNKDRKQGIPTTKKGSNFLNKSLIWIRVNLVIPDLKVFWILDSKKEILQLVEHEKPDAIVTTGPPHSIHFAGNYIRKSFNLPWIADFRDPWSDWDIYHHFNISRLSKNIHKKLEKGVLDNASSVITVSQYWVDKLSKKTSTPVIKITNGYDPEDFKDYQNSPSQKFKISYFGVLDKYRMIPEFWTALNELSIENPILWSDLEIYMRGIIDAEIKDHINQYTGLREKVFIGDYIPHDQLVQELNESWVLLLILYDAPNTAGTLTGKLFEYLASGKFILGLGDPEGEAAHIIKKTQSGIILQFNNIEEIKKIILEQYEKFKEGILHIPCDTESYKRTFLTKKLAGELVNLVEGK